MTGNTFTGYVGYGCRMIYGEMIIKVGRVTDATIATAIAAAISRSVMGRS